MKTKTLVKKGIFLICFLGFLLCFYNVSYADDAVTYISIAEADAQTTQSRPDNYKNDPNMLNYGHNGGIYVRNHDGIYGSKGYLRFNLGPIDSVDKVILRLYSPKGLNDNLLVYGIFMPFSEESITWNNAPEPLPFTPLANQPIVQGWNEIDLTEHIQGLLGTYSAQSSGGIVQQAASDLSVSFMLEALTPQYQGVCFISREGRTDLRPQLVVTHSSGIVPPENPGEPEGSARLVRDGVIVPGFESVTPQEAVDAAIPGDEVILSSGRYYEAINITKSGTQEKPIVIRGDGFTRPVIDGSGFTNRRDRTAVNINAENIIVDYLEVKDMASMFGFDNPRGIMISSSSNNVTIRNCYVHHNYRGISVSGKNTTIENCEIAYNHSIGSGSARAFTVNGKGTTTIRYNNIHANGGMGYSDHSEYTIFAYNYVHDNGNYEAEFLSSTAFSNPQDALIIGNIFKKPPYSTKKYFTVLFGYDRHGGTGIFINNTIISNQSNRCAAIKLWDKYNTGMDSMVLFNNIFYNAAYNDAPVITVAALRQISGSNNWIQGTAAGYDGLVNSVFGEEPGFVDLSGGDYRLLSDSACVDAGNNDIAPLPDKEYVHPQYADLKPIDGNVDIGAYEYITGELSIGTEKLDNGALGTEYSHTLSAFGGEKPYLWAIENIENGDLPDGLLLDSVSGVISGTPARVGDYNFTIRVSDTSGSVKTKELSVKVKTALKTYTITPEVMAEKGSMSPAGSITLTEGEDITFVARPEIGYHLEDIKVDGVSPSILMPFVTLKDIDRDHTVQVYFDINKYTLDLTAVNGGVDVVLVEGIESSEMVYTHGSKLEFTPAGDIGYEFVEWSGSLSGVSVPANFTMTTNKSVTAVFSDYRDGHIIYVDPAAATGLQDALEIDTVKPGDTIILPDGTYTYNTSVISRIGGTRNHPITIKAENSGKAILTRRGRVLEITKPNYRMEGLVLDGQFGTTNGMFRVQTAAHGLYLKDCVFRNNMRHIINMTSPENVTVDGCEIYHGYWFKYDGKPIRDDAHGISTEGVKNLTIRNTYIHDVSGDSLQPEYGNWDNILVENCDFSNGPVTQANAEAVATSMDLAGDDWTTFVGNYSLNTNNDPNDDDEGIAGKHPGENAIDTKSSGSNIRGRIILRNSKFYGWRSVYIANAAALNLKMNITAVVENCEIYGNTIALRLRGKDSAPDGAHVTVKNCVIYNNDFAIRSEDSIRYLHIWNNTFGLGNVNPYIRVSGGLHETFEAYNNLFIESDIPPDMMNTWNINVGIDDVIDASNNNYYLRDDDTVISPAIDSGITLVDVRHDKDGNLRPYGTAYDIGAYEHTGGEPPVFYSLTVEDGTGSGSYVQNAKVEIEADPASEGQKFKEWGGDTDVITTGDINSKEITITMPDRNIRLRAVYEDVTIPVYYSMVVENSTGSNDYKYNAIVTVKADTASLGQKFKAWTGDIQYITLIEGTVNSEEIIFRMPAQHITLTATYEDIPVQAQYIITSYAGSEGSIEPSGDVKVDAGGSVTFYITPGRYNPDCDFDGDERVWLGDWGVLRDVFGLKAGDANYDPAVDLNHDSIIDFRDFGIFRAAFGAKKDSPGYKIADVIIGDGQSMGPVSSYTFSDVTADNRIYATFVLSDSDPVNKYTLTIDPETDNGYIELDPAGGVYDEGAVVTVRAMPDSGYTIKKWSGDLSGDSATQTIIMNSDKKISATFKDTTGLFVFTTNKLGEGNIEVSPESSAGYAYNTKIAVKAIPRADYQFLGWAGDFPFREQDEDSIEITMDDNKSLTAIFSWVGTGAISRGPYLQPTSDMETSVGVAWRTANSVVSTIYYGIDDVEENYFTTEEGTEHYIRITDLVPAAKYKYKVVADGDTTPVYEFRTSPSEGHFGKGPNTEKNEPFRVIVGSDWHFGGNGQRASFVPLYPDILEFDPDVIFLTGDTADLGHQPEDYDELFTLCRELLATSIFTTTTGNHEWAYDTNARRPDENPNSQDRLGYFVEQYYFPENGPECTIRDCAKSIHPDCQIERTYSFDFGGVHFLAVNSNYKYMEDWAKQDLAAAKDRGNRFIFTGMHYPEYLDTHWDRALKGDYSHKIINDEYGVDIQFGGHRHMYQRTYPLLSNPYDMQDKIYEWGMIVTPETGDPDAEEKDPDIDKAYTANTEGTIYVQNRSLWYSKPVGYPDLHYADHGKRTGLGFTKIEIDGKKCTAEAVFYTKGTSDSYKEDRYVIDKNITDPVPVPDVSNVEVMEVKAYTANITWKSKDEYGNPMRTRGQVEFWPKDGIDPALGINYYINTREDQYQVFTDSHEAKLQCLTPDTTYYFRVKSWRAGEEKESDEFSFTTASKPSEDESELIAEFDFGGIMYRPEGSRVSTNYFDESLRNGWIISGYPWSLGLYAAGGYPAGKDDADATKTFRYRHNKYPPATWRALLPDGEYDVEVTSSSGGYFFGDTRIIIEGGQGVLEFQQPPGSISDRYVTKRVWGGTVDVKDGLDLLVGTGDNDSPKESIISRVRIWTKGYFLEGYEPDLTPPAQISDLEVTAVTPNANDAGKYDVTLSWTAPGDDGNVGQATKYDIRYNHYNAGGKYWFSYSKQVEDEPVPALAGTSESYTVKGLAAGLEYTFLMQTIDEADNNSTYSNEVGVIPGPDAATLWVTLEANPDPVSPFENVTLTAKVFGTATGEITYNLFKNNSTGEAEIRKEKENEIVLYTDTRETLEMPEEDRWSYPLQRTYYAKVVVKRGELMAQTRVEINVTGEPPVVTQHFLTVNVQGNGTVSPGSGLYDENVQLTLKATPEAGWTFGGWSGVDAENGASADVTMSLGRTVTATFVKDPSITKYFLTVNIQGNGSVSPDSGLYEENAELTLTAIPGANYIFDSWSGDLSGGNAAQIVLMDSDKTVTAFFKEDTPIPVNKYTLTIDSQITNGAITLNPAGGVYDEGRVVTVTAIPDTGYVFYTWSGDHFGNISPTTITMTSDKMISASFVEVIINPSGEITRGPYLQPTEDMETSVGVAWRTATGGSSTIYYGIESPNKYSITVDPEEAIGDEVIVYKYYTQLQNLTPGGIYRYRVESNGDVRPHPGEGSDGSDYYEFKTSPPDGSFKILVGSDWHHYSYDRLEACLPDMIAFNPDIIFMTGDLANKPTQSEYDDLFVASRKLFAIAILAPMPGNHDWGDIDLYADQFYLPENGPEDQKEHSYSFDYGTTHFTALYKTDQDWLINDLSAARSRGGVDFLFSGLHVQTYANNVSRRTLNLKDSGRTAIYDTHDVDIEFSGHNHVHERTYPLINNDFDPSQWGIVYTPEKEHYGANIDGTIFHECRSMFYSKGISFPNLYSASVGDGGIGYVEVVLSKKNPTDPKANICAVTSIKYPSPLDASSRTITDYYEIDKSDTDELPIPEVFDVNVTELGAYRAVIEWESDIDSRGQVEFGLAPGDYSYVDMREDQNQVFTASHSAVLQCLIPGTTYYYRVKSWRAGKEGVGEEGSFTTPAQAAKGELAAEFDFGGIMFPPDGVRVSSIPAPYTGGSSEVFDPRIRQGIIYDGSYFYLGNDAMSFPVEATGTFLYRSNSAAPATWRTELPNGEYDIEVTVGQGGYYFGDTRIVLEDSQVILEAESPGGTIGDRNSILWIWPASVTVEDGFLDVKLGYGSDGYYRTTIINRIRVWTKGHYSPGTEADFIAPARIKDLTVLEVTEDSVTLTWTAPGNDGMIGRAARYDIRYYHYDIGSYWHTKYALHVEDEPTPEEGGTIQSYTVTGLTPGRNYTFCMQAVDDTGNNPGHSNMVAAKPGLDPDTLSVSITADPGTGIAPLENVSLTATVSGTQEGDISYFFYANRKEIRVKTAFADARYEDVSGATMTAPNIGNYMEPGKYYGKVFVERNGLKAENRVEITVTYSFPVSKHTLTIDPEPVNGSIVLDPAGGVYDEGTVVTVTAQPDSGYVFEGWSGTLPGSANTVSITIDSDKAVTALFKKDTQTPVNKYTLTIDPQPVNGSIELNLAGGVYDEGTVVTVTAVPDTGYTFNTWTGIDYENSLTATVTMNGDRSVTATFIEDTTPPQPPSGEPFFRERNYRLVAKTAVPAGDLSGVTFNTRSNTVFLLNESNALFEVKRNGDTNTIEILRRIEIINPGPPPEPDKSAGYDLEAVCYVRTESDGRDLFAFLAEDYSLDQEDTSYLVLAKVGHGLDDTTIDLRNTELNPNNVQTYRLTGWHQEALAYDADMDTGGDMGTFYMGAEKNIWHITVDESGENTIEIPHSVGKIKDLFLNSRLGPNLFKLYYDGVHELTPEGTIRSSFLFPDDVTGKLEGMAFDPNTKDIYVVKESSPRIDNLFCFEATSTYND